jgi:GNAT superfamily N-acetyltransferase
MSIRPLTPGDIDFALTQIHHEGWVKNRAVFESIIEHGPQGCFIAEPGGKPAAMLTTARFGPTGWIGHLIVLPEHRNKGLGTRMMKHAIQHLHQQGVATIRLEADPPGMGIYKRLGFSEEYESLRFRFFKTTEPSPAIPLLKKDIDDVLAFDQRLSGEDRGRYLKILNKKAKQSLVIRRDNDLAGYLLAMPTAKGVNLGPCLATDKNTAAQLLKAAPAGITTVGLPAPNRKGVALLQELGFDPRPSSIRMFLGPRPTQEPGHIYGIANGATG